MDLHTTHEYSADPDRVFAMLTDEAFLRGKLEARGDRNVEVVECGPAADGYRIVTKRTVTIDVPGPVKKFLKPSNTVTQTDVWAEPMGDVRQGHWTVDASGVPVTMKGTMRLETTPSGSVERIDGTAQSGIPIVGGRIAKVVGDTTMRSLEHEHGFAQEWLAR